MIAIADAAQSTFRVGFVTGIGSDDGQTLEFVLPDLLDACAFTQVDADESCPMIGLPPPDGETELFVTTADRESNRLSIRIDAP